MILDAKKHNAVNDRVRAMSLPAMSAGGWTLSPGTMLA